MKVYNTNYLGNLIDRYSSYVNVNSSTLPRIESCPKRERKNMLYSRSHVAGLHHGLLRFKRLLDSHQTNQELVHGCWFLSACQTAHKRWSGHKQPWSGVWCEPGQAMGNRDTCLKTTWKRPLAGCGNTQLTSNPFVLGVRTWLSPSIPATKQLRSLHHITTCSAIIYQRFLHTPGCVAWLGLWMVVGHIVSLQERSPTKATVD